MATPVRLHPHLPRPFATEEPPLRGRRVELQLFSTLQCNLKCTYCSESVGGVRGSDGHVSYSMEALDRFVLTHLAGHEVRVTFYGGEPMMNTAFIQRVMAAYPDFAYQMQTNGTLLHRLPDDVCAGLSHVLVSVDGGPQTTDAFRGRGVYRRVMRNIAKIRGKLRAPITARVTWTSGDTTLAELEGLLDDFDYVYFQFAHDDRYGAAELARKKEVVSAMVERFFERQGRYPMIPIMGIVRNKAMPELAGAETSGCTQCRVSTSIINVLPDGNIYPCPDMAWAHHLRQGNIEDNTLHRSALQLAPAMPCRECEAFAWCRTNCMKNQYRAYVESDLAYRAQVVDPICELVKHAGREVDRHPVDAFVGALPREVRDELAHCEVYDWVEVMP